MPKPRNHQERITLDDNVMSIVMKLSDGNPGAVTVCVQLMSDRNDPDCFLGPLGNFLSLDTHGIYGSDIWVLFKNVCDQRILGVVTVLRAVQLGLYTEREMWQCIDSCIPIDVDGLLLKVQKELPNFGRHDSSVSSFAA
jgi:hypothetical protein